MTTLKFPKVLTACKTRGRCPVPQTQNSWSLVPGSEEDEHARLGSGRPSVSQEEVKNFEEKSKAKQAQNNKIQFFLRKKKYIVLGWCWPWIIFWKHRCPAVELRWQTLMSEWSFKVYKELVPAGSHLGSTVTLGASSKTLYPQLLGE